MKTPKQKGVRFTSTQIVLKSKPRKISNSVQSKKILLLDSIKLLLDIDSNTHIVRFDWITAKLQSLSVTPVKFKVQSSELYTYDKKKEDWFVKKYNSLL